MQVFWRSDAFTQRWLIVARQAIHDLNPVVTIQVEASHVHGPDLGYVTILRKGHPDRPWFVACQQALRKSTGLLRDAAPPLEPLDVLILGHLPRCTAFAEAIPAARTTAVRATRMGM